MESRSGIPKYVQIVEHLRSQIRRGALKPNDRVPTVLELMKIHEVSKITAVRVLRELQSEGLIRSRQGQGSFVNDPLAVSAEKQANGEQSIAVIVPDIANPFYSEIVSAIERKTQARGYTIHLSSCAYDPERMAQTLRSSLEGNALAGVIMFPFLNDSEGIDARTLRRVPFVLLDSVPAALEGQVSYVITDNLRGGYHATHHLLNLGHRRIGYVHYADTSAERIKGYRKAMSEYGQEEFLLSLGNVRMATEEVFGFVSANELTGLFASNDLLAISIKQLLEQHGLKVPEDVSLVGYDNIEVTQFLDVPLTTVDQHEDDLGGRAAEIVMRLHGTLGSAERIYEVVLEPSLTVRASTAPPAEPRAAGRVRRAGRHTAA